MKLACVQFDIAWEDKPANHAKVREMLAQANLPGGSLVALPEMFATGFSMNVAAIDDEASQATQTFVRELSRELGLYLVAGVVTRGPDSLGRNQAMVTGPDGLELTRYQKIHPFTFGGEPRHYSSGQSVVTFEWNGFTVAPFICYDLRFPEIFRAAARRGANVMVVIANWPAARAHHWVTLAQARAIENQAYVVAVNRVGSDPRVTYGGRSLIIGPRGNVMADGSGEEQVLAADVDLEALKSYRWEFPALKDIRPGFLGG